MKLKLKLNKKPTNINTIKSSNNSERKIVFRHGRAPGDNIMFSAGIRDFCLLFPNIKVNVHMKYPWIWENNPYLDRNIKNGEENVEYYKVGYPAISSCNGTYIHFTQMFLLDMIAVTDLHQKLPISLGEFCSAFANGNVEDFKEGISKNHKDIFQALRNRYGNFCEIFSRQRGDLHLSNKEKSENLVKDVYGIEKYWVIAPGGKRDFTAKIWDWRRFQKVINYFDGLIKFVVIGRSDLLMEKLNGVLDLTDKFNGNKIRGLVPLVYHAEGCVSSPSLLMHLAAAVPPRFKKERKPCVSIFGGREPTGWSMYTNHQILHTNASFSCCSYGGCWKNRTYPIQKNPEKNTSLCKYPVEVDGRTVQRCMDTITSDDVIRAIEKYYEGDLYTFEKKNKSKKRKSAYSVNMPKIYDNYISTSKEINLVGNLNSKGGGEQSLCKIAEVLTEAGWSINLYPWGSVHENYRSNGLPIKIDASFESGRMSEDMKEGLPLLFYANDCTRGFAEFGKDIVSKSSSVIIGINYINRPLPNCRWLAESGKVKAIIFQNTEKKEEWDRDEIGYNGLRKFIMFGAIDLDRFLEVCPPQRSKKHPLIILKHCVPDYRKYVTSESVGKGEKIHLWQKHFDKEKDTKFYRRLLKSHKNIRFEFMEAHKELKDYFKDESRMKFHKFDSIPVTDFLSKGHVYLYRTSNLWRDNYPRTVAEALAAGLPVLTEPRDGTWERVKHGDTGFHCVHFDEYSLAIKTFLRKEKMRYAMAQKCKDWARNNLDPRKWVDVIEDILDA